MKTKKTAGQVMFDAYHSALSRSLGIDCPNWDDASAEEKKRCQHAAIAVCQLVYKRRPKRPR